MANQKNEDRKSLLLAVFLLLLSGFFVFLFLKPDSNSKDSRRSTASTAMRSKQYEDNVNQYLYRTSAEIDLARKKAELEASKLNAGDLHKGASQDFSKTPQSLDFSEDPRAEALLKALGREAETPGRATNPEEQIQAELFEDQQQQAYSEEYKREYARQFVENARKAGYLVRLSEDYKVISVKPLRAPAQKFDLFQSQGGGVQ